MFSPGRLFRRRNERQAGTLSLKGKQMRNYNLGSLNSWKPLGIGEILDFETPDAGFRSVAFDILASGMIAVHAVSGEDYWLVGYGDGELSIKFAIDRPVGVVCIGDAATEVFIRTQLETPVIPESLEASYTTIEPRPAGPSDDFRQMMQWVKLNQQRREAQLIADMERRIEEVTARSQPVPEPAPAPAPASDDPVVE